MFKPENKAVAPTAQGDQNYDDGSFFDGVDWLTRANSAYYSSTSYMDTNYRKVWEDSIRAFHSQFPSDSKYNAPAYEKRSRLYRPKVRTIIRKNEAASAAAFFSNMDTVSVGAQDQSNKRQLMNAEIMKGLLQYRLTKSIPWFQVVQGGIQDAQTMGVVAAHIYWKYEEEEGDEVLSTTQDEENPAQEDLPVGAFTLGGAPGDSEVDAAQPQVRPAMQRPAKRVLVDKPVVDLIPVENLRVDPAAGWTDPIHSSPYVIHLIPTYVMDVKAKMKSGEWNTMSDGMLSRATSVQDSTRQTRQKDRDDPTTSDGKDVHDYEIVWVYRHIHKHKGKDIEFYTLSDIAMLTAPRPLEESVLHGRRPYEMGCCIIESHRIMPSGVYPLGKGLQDEANEVVNQRLDNVKFALNKKWFAKRGRDVDVGGLIRNVPGGVVMMDDPEKDVREISWPDVTQSAYEEQNRINLDMDELLGNFNPAGLMAQGAHQNSPARNMSMLNQSTGTMTEYLIRTYVETFVQPVLRQLVLLEQFYETDETLLTLVGNNAQLFDRFGLSEITDDLLRQELTLTVNVGMGATDPTTKLQKFLTAMNSFAAMAKAPPPGINLQEVGKEIFGHLGYSDGSRFFTNDNPQVLALQQQLQQMQGEMQKMQQQLTDKMVGHQVSLQKVSITNQTKEKIATMQEENENRRSYATHIGAIMRAQHDHQSSATLAQHRHASDVQLAGMKNAAKPTAGK